MKKSICSLSIPATRQGMLIAMLVVWCWAPTFADEQIAAAAHVHSAWSTGRKRILEIAELAKKSHVDVVLLTDLLYEGYEYGLWPFRGLIKARVERDSILKGGADRYLKEIEEANQRVPGVLMIDGTAATPFYYWSGSLWPGPLILNNRAKDFLVIGLGKAEAYENLPVIGTGKSGFSPYEGEKYAGPYQRFIDYTNQKGGLVFWSHPNAEEHRGFKEIWGGRIRVDTTPYSEDMAATFRYTGFGVFSVELAQIDSPEHKGLSSLGGIWDRLLLEYCQGRRKEPLWALGEVDYNGEEISSLDSILNILTVKEKSREEVLGALKEGRLYLIALDRQGRRMVLHDFSVQDSGSALLIKLSLAHETGSSGAVHLVLIRNGEVLQEWEQPLPVDYEFRDSIAPSTMSYYRLIVQSNEGGRLLSNPIFARRPLN